ncbi:polysaccharide deacetylase family protein [bacterium]|nr:MAG: polysaccharide deacetylase family protein [bacterium]
MSIRSRFHNFFDGGLIQSTLSDMSYKASIERLGRLLIKRVVWRNHTDEKRIALTFDDGPHPLYTTQILAILREYSVQATFFLIGKHLSNHPNLAQSIVDSGHEIANHTYSHQLLVRLSNDEIKREIQSTHELLSGLNGQNPRFLRPPMGLFSKRVLDVIEESGYRTVVGDVYPRDPHRPGKDKIVKRILSRTQAGSIIILHDGGNTEVVDRSQTVDALKEIIPTLKQRGFEFVTLSEMFKISLESNNTKNNKLG